MSAFGRLLPIETIRRMSALGEWPLKRSTLILRLYQRNALKAFWASGWDVDGHDQYFASTLLMQEKPIRLQDRQGIYDHSGIPFGSQNGYVNG